MTYSEWKLSRFAWRYLENWQKPCKITKKNGDKEVVTSMLYFRVDFLKLIQKIRICCKNLFIVVNTRVNPAVYFQSRLFQCYNLSFSKRTFGTIRFRLRLKTVLFSWVLRTTLIVSKKKETYLSYRLKCFTGKDATHKIHTKLHSGTEWRHADVTV